MKLDIPSDIAAAPLAVALSGGADSLALAHMLARTHGNLHLLTVDHALRPESGDEARQVADLVANWVANWPGVAHATLRWEGAKPSTRRMESARAARYALMAEYARAHGIRTLALAHHRDDQTETFLLRLARGSGIDGLAAMRERTQRDEMTLWRPLLASHTHADLVAYCREHGLAWIEDPTNANDKYARNRLRMALRGEGLNDTRLDATLRRIERAADTLRLLSDRLATRASVAHDDAAWVFDLNALRTEPFELALRVLRRAVDEQAGAAGYGARLDRLEDLARELLESPAATARTLGGCVLRVDPHAGTLSVAAEIPAQAAKTLPLAANGL